MIDLDRLLKLRLIVARHGEMDRAKWWNTNGMLGPVGAMALKRGFPRTHLFAQARAVFAVATARSQEIFDPPGAATLWALPAEIEDEFDERWQDWLRAQENWRPLFDSLASPEETPLLDALAANDVISPDQVAQVQSLETSAEGRAVALESQLLDDGIVTLLAAGFEKGSMGAPAIPFVKLVA